MNGRCVYCGEGAALAYRFRPDDPADVRALAAARTSGVTVCREHGPLVELDADVRPVSPPRSTWPPFEWLAVGL